MTCGSVRVVFVLEKVLCSQAEQHQKEASIQQEDSDLEKKRREAEALLQSVGITPDAAVGGFTLTDPCLFLYAALAIKEMYESKQNNLIITKSLK